MDPKDFSQTIHAMRRFWACALLHFWKFDLYLCSIINIRRGPLRPANVSQEGWAKHIEWTKLAEGKPPFFQDSILSKKPWWKTIVHWFTASVHENYTLRICCINKCSECQNKNKRQFVYTTCSDLVVFMYWTGKSMNNILPYCWLIETRIRASYKDLPVRKSLSRNWFRMVI